jgi:acyl-CoA thioesterase FadM
VEHGELLAAASVRVVCVGSSSFRPRRLPHSIIEGLH